MLSKQDPSHSIDVRLPNITCEDEGKFLCVSNNRSFIAQNIALPEKRVTSHQLSSDTTQDEVRQYWKDASGLDDPPIGSTLISDNINSKNVSFEYYNSKWNYIGIYTIPIATTNDLGLVKGSNDTNGKIFVDNTGEMFLIGFDKLMSKSGGEFTGSIILAEDPTNDLYAATKRYVDYTSNNIATNIYNKLGGYTTTSDFNSALSLKSDLNAPNFTNNPKIDNKSIATQEFVTDTIQDNLSKYLAISDAEITYVKDTILTNTLGNYAKIDNPTLNNPIFSGTPTLVTVKAGTASSNGVLLATEAQVYTTHTLANTANTTANAAMPKSGGTFTGNVSITNSKTLTLSGAPTNDLHAATKKYVDNEINKVPANVINIQIVGGDQREDSMAISSSYQYLIKNRSWFHKYGRICHVHLEFTYIGYSDGDGILYLPEIYKTIDPFSIPVTCIKKQGIRVIIRCLMHHHLRQHLWLFMAIAMKLVRMLVSHMVM
jgi:hypothetical protein